MIKDLCNATDKWEAAIAMQPEAAPTWESSSAEDVISRNTPKHDHQGEKTYVPVENFAPTMNFDEVDGMREEIRSLNLSWKRKGKSNKIRVRMAPNTYM